MFTTSNVRKDPATGEVVTRRLICKDTNCSGYGYLHTQLGSNELIATLWEPKRNHNVCSYTSDQVVAMIAARRVIKIYDMYHKYLFEQNYKKCPSLKNSVLLSYYN